MEIPQSESDAMKLFGLNPVLAADQDLWARTTPKDDVPVTDYSEDSFEIGGIQPTTGKGTGFGFGEEGDEEFLGH